MAVKNKTLQVTCVFSRLHTSKVADVKLNQVTEGQHCPGMTNLSRDRQLSTTLDCPPELSAQRFSSKSPCNLPACVFGTKVDCLGISVSTAIKNKTEQNNTN